MKNQFLLLLLILFYSFSQAQSKKAKFIYGVNGHPLTQESYRGNLDLQLNLLKELKCKYYRVDVAIDSDGNVIDKAGFMALINKAKVNKITVLPVLVLSKNLYNIKSEEEAYAQGVKYGKNFGSNYKNYFTYYEVGNEEGSNVIVSAEVDGDRSNQYNSTKLSKLMPYFKGVCESIKKADPTAKIIINEGWVHYGFFEALKYHKVKYDIIGYHGYSDMGDINKARKGFGNVVDTLYKKFQKKIWLTEINVRNGTSMKVELSSDQWLERNLSFAHRSKYVDAVFIYELLDQPAFDNPNSPYRNPAEAYYGLVAWEDKYVKVKRKPVFATYKKIIASHP